jgi:hypothetical protein
MSLTDAEVIALAERFRDRAKLFMQEAAELADFSDIAKLTGMASSLRWAARELCDCARIDPRSGPWRVTPQANGHTADADKERSRELQDAPNSARRLYRLAHSAGEQQYTQIGRARETFDGVVNAAREYNDIRAHFRLPVLTHVVAYELIEIVELAELGLLANESRPDQ